MLGIGCKSPFAYTDSFIVNAYLDGVLTSWNAHIDPSGRGAMAKMVSTPTTEPNGIEVVIPVKANDIQKFFDKGFYLYSYYAITPEFVNVKPEQLKVIEERKNAKAHFEGTDWKYTGSGERSIAIMGNIPYPIDTVVLGDEINPEARTLLSGGLIINFKNGDLEFAASREALQYTPATKKNLITKINNVTKDILDQATSSFKNCKTLWDAKCLYREVFDYYGKLYAIRGLFRTQLKFGGHSLSNDTFQTGTAGGNVYVRRFTKRNGTKVAGNDAYEIQANSRHLVVENDTNILNGVINRVIALLETKDGSKPTYDSVFVMKFKDAQAKADWLKSSGFDSAITSLATLPKNAIKDFYPDYGTGASSMANAKHSSREFSFSGASLTRYAYNKSDYWTAEDVDVDKDAGVYLELDRFEFKSNDKNNYGRFEHPSYINEIVKYATALGIKMPAKIYGFKKSSVAKAEKNKQMVSFWKWLNDEIATYFKTNQKEEQTFVDYEYVTSKVHAIHHNLSDFVGWLTLADWSKVSTKSSFVVFTQHAAKVLNRNTAAYKNYEVVQAMLKWTDYKMSAKPTIDIQKEYDAAKARYPLIFNIHSEISNYRLRDAGWSKSLAEYVTMVDTVTP
jgi:hypothetical protein